MLVDDGRGCEASASGRTKRKTGTKRKRRTGVWWFVAWGSRIRRARMIASSARALRAICGVRIMG